VRASSVLTVQEDRAWRIERSRFGSTSNWTANGGLAVYQNPKNHKLEGKKVIINGQVLEHPKGNFYLSWYDGEKKKWKKIGPRLKDAEIQADLQKYKMEGAARGVTVIMPDSNRLRLESAAADYLEEVKLSRRPATHELLKFDLDEFVKWSRLDFVDEDGVVLRCWLRFSSMLTPPSMAA
jgi:hypothetical protein